MAERAAGAGRPVGGTANSLRDSAEAFDEQRAHLVSLAHRILGSRTDAEDAVQEAWFRLARQD